MFWQLLLYIIVVPLIKVCRLYKTLSGYLNNPFMFNAYFGFLLSIVELILTTKNVMIQKKMMPLAMIGIYHMGIFSPLSNK